MGYLDMYNNEDGYGVINSEVVVEGLKSAAEIADAFKEDAKLKNSQEERIIRSLDDNYKETFKHDNEVLKIYQEQLKRNDLTDDMRSRILDDIKDIHDDENKRYEENRLFYQQMHEDRRTDTWTKWRVVCAIATLGASEGGYQLVTRIKKK